MKIFITYSRESQDQVLSLIKDLEGLGHEIWYDRNLSGGQSWWDNILLQIRGCELYVFTLSQSALDSVACMRELKYAEALSKSCLPVLLSSDISMAMAPRSLSHTHYVDYRDPDDKNVILGLVKAIRSIQKSPGLTANLPDEPPVPISYLDTLKEKVDAPKLDKDEQIRLLRDLKIRLNDDQIDGEDIISLLTRLRRHDDLYASIAAEIDEVLDKQSSEIDLPDGRSTGGDPLRQNPVIDSGSQDHEKPSPTPGSEPASLLGQSGGQQSRHQPAVAPKTDEKSWSTGAMIGLVIATLFMPPVGAIAGVIGLVGGIRRKQVILLISVSVVLMLLVLVAASIDSQIYY